MEATPAHKLDEIHATKTMINRVEERFDLKPDRLISDTNYGTAEILGWMVNEKNIEAACPGLGQTSTRERRNRNPCSQDVNNLGTVQLDRYTFLASFQLMN